LKEERGETHARHDHSTQAASPPHAGHYIDDDFAGTCDIITIHPEAFTLSRQEIARELRELIAGWIEEMPPPEKLNPASA
jgi:transaldolase